MVLTSLSSFLHVCFLCHICPTLRNPPHYFFSVCSLFIIFFCFGNFLHTSVLFSAPYLISSSFIAGPTASVPSFILDIFAFSLAHLGDRSRFCSGLFRGGLGNLQLTGCRECHSHRVLLLLEVYIVTESWKTRARWILSLFAHRFNPTSACVCDQHGHWGQIL